MELNNDLNARLLCFLCHLTYIRNVTPTLPPRPQHKISASEVLERADQSQWLTRERGGIIKIIVIIVDMKFIPPTWLIKKYHPFLLSLK